MAKRYSPVSGEMTMASCVSYQAGSTVTIAAPGQSVENEQPTHTASITQETSRPPAVQSDEAIVVETTQTVTVVVPRESAEDEQPAYTGSTETEVAGSTAGETPATEPGAIPGTDKTALDNNDS